MKFIILTILISEELRTGQTSPGIPRLVLSKECKTGEASLLVIEYIRTQYCDDCLEITVTSSGGAAEHQPQTLGRWGEARSWNILTLIELFLITVDTPWPGQCGKTWYHSGGLRMTSSSAPTPTATQSSSTLNGSSLNLLAIMTQVGKYI